ncbi:ABC transporter ATP-binding protein [Salipiger sp. H15]|uniref:ABC transporter ATP-binding protein n=1 Tax=Alloyangia sp. H15 TaxID=3029062 RepID=A0AAU8AP33_9RHOB
MGGTMDRILFLLDSRARRRLWRVFAVSIGMGLADMAAVLSIAPFLMVAARPQAALENPRLAALRGALGIEGETGFLVLLALGSLGMLTAAILFRIWGHTFLRGFVRGQSVSLASRLVSRYMRAPLDTRLRRHSAELVSNIQSEVERVVNGVMMNAVRLLTGVSTAASLAIMLVVVEPRAALTMGLLLGLGYGAIFAAVRGPMRRVGAERMRATRETARLLSEALAGSREVKLYGMEQSYLDRFESAFRRRAEATTTADLLRDVPKSVLEVLTFGTMILLVVWTLVEQGEGSSALPVVALYAFAAARLFPALQRIYASAAALRGDLPAVDELHADLAAVEGLGLSDALPGEGLPLREALELRGVGYDYPDGRGQLIRDLDLRVPAGQIVGLVGATGAGKSTILDMMTGLIRPDTGGLYVDGTRIEAGNLARWRRSVAYVPQDSCMIEGTIGDNIRFGFAPAGDAAEALRRAGSFAGLDGLIAELPEGYETPLGERGQSLSVGQRQRIGIARAVFRDPALLVLDESTSALDTISEAELTAAVQGLRGRTTVVIVAHRLSSVRGCDLIYLIGAGRVLEQGSYAELTGRESKFHAFHRAGT